MKGNMLSSRRAVHIFLILIVGVSVYAFTLDVPFQWDEMKFITKSPVTKDLSYFLEPSKATGPARAILRDRYVGYLTFALDYRAHGMEVAGYHVVNHLAASLLVYFLVLLTFRTPCLEGSALKDKGPYIALLASVLFVAHPLQTEAVTYIFQRLASLVAFFYLLSLVAYIKSRLAAKAGPRYAFYALSLASAALAMKTKENAFTLPLAVALYEFAFFRGGLKRRLLGLSPLLLTLLIIPLSRLGLHRAATDLMGGVKGVTRGSGTYTPMEYLLTQFNVLLTYLRLMFLPVNQNLDYDYPVYRSILDPGVITSLAFHLVAVGGAVYFLIRSRRAGKGGLVMVSFGVLWFYLTASVESGIVPIPMLIDEYRAYLPGVGVIMAGSVGLFALRERLKGPVARRAVVGVAVALVLMFSTLTYARNSLWRDRVTLWEDVVQKSPRKARDYYNLAESYREERRDLATARKYFEKTLELDPLHSQALNNLGNLSYLAGSLANAADFYRRAHEADGNNYEALYNLARTLDALGSRNEARKYYEEFLQSAPPNFAGLFPSIRQRLD